MKIAIITSGRLPVPATKGGAVETKLDYILDYNARHHIMDITVYSVKPDKDIDKSTPENHYVFYSLHSLWARLRMKIFRKTHTCLFYDHHIEYFLHRCIEDIRKKTYDCVLLLNRPGYVLTLRDQLRSKIIIQIDNDYLNPKVYRVKEIMQTCSMVITCSDYLSSRARQVECDDNIPIVTVHNGIDIGSFINAKPLDRASAGLSDDDFVVVYSGRLIKEKGIIELIKAIKLIQSAIPSLKLIILGASFYGSDKQATPFMQLLEKEAEPVKEKVKFTGYINYDQMPSYLKLADIAVVPSMWEEPFGLTVVEAMAAGLPLITTRSGGIPEICEGAAIIVERDGIVSHLADAISDLYHHSDKREQLSTSALQRAKSFDKEAYAKKFLETIMEGK